MKLLLPFSLIVASTATASGYRLPEEKPITQPPGPNAELTAATCSACHLLDYL